MEKLLQTLEKHTILIEFLSSLMPIILTILGLYIAIQQYRTNRKRIKIDLFEKRFSVFVAINKFISAIAKEGGVTQEQRMEFISDTRGAEFLFDKKIKLYIDKIWEATVDAGVWTEDNNYANSAAERAEAKKWLFSELKNMDSRFHKYLRLKH